MLVRTDGHQKNQALRMCSGGPVPGVLLGQCGFGCVSVPLVDNKVEVLQIAFLIEAQHTCWGVELVSAQGFSYLGRIGIASQLDAFRPCSAD